MKPVIIRSGMETVSNLSRHVPGRSRCAHRGEEALLDLQTENRNQKVPLDRKLERWEVEHMSSPR